MGHYNSEMGDLPPDNRPATRELLSHPSYVVREAAVKSEAIAVLQDILTRAAWR